MSSTFLRDKYTSYNEGGDYMSFFRRKDKKKAASKRCEELIEECEKSLERMDETIKHADEDIAKRKEFLRKRGVEI